MPIPATPGLTSEVQLAVLEVVPRDDSFPLLKTLCPLCDHTDPHVAATHSTGDRNNTLRHFDEEHGIPRSAWPRTRRATLFGIVEEEASDNRVYFQPGPLLDFFAQHAGTLDLENYVKQLVGVYGVPALEVNNWANARADSLRDARGRAIYDSDVKRLISNAGRAVEQANRNRDGIPFTTPLAPPPAAPAPRRRARAAAPAPEPAPAPSLPIYPVGSIVRTRTPSQDGSDDFIGLGETRDYNPRYGQGYVSTPWLASAEAVANYVRQAGYDDGNVYIGIDPVVDHVGNVADFPEPEPADNVLSSLRLPATAPEPEVVPFEEGSIIRGVSRGDASNYMAVGGYANGSYARSTTFYDSAEDAASAWHADEDDGSFPHSSVADWLVVGNVRDFAPSQPAAPSPEPPAIPDAIPMMTVLFRTNSDGDAEYAVIDGSNTEPSGETNYTYTVSTDLPTARAGAGQPHIATAHGLRMAMWRIYESATAPPQRSQTTYEAGTAVSEEVVRPTPGPTEWGVLPDRLPRGLLLEHRNFGGTTTYAFVLDQNGDAVSRTFYTTSVADAHENYENGRQRDGGPDSLRFMRAGGDGQWRVSAQQPILGGIDVPATPAEVAPSAPPARIAAPPASPANAPPHHAVGTILRNEGYGWRTILAVDFANDSYIVSRAYNRRYQAINAYVAYHGGCPEVGVEADFSHFPAEATAPWKPQGRINARSTTTMDAYRPGAVVKDESDDQLRVIVSLDKSGSRPTLRLSTASFSNLGDVQATFLAGWRTGPSAYATYDADFVLGHWTVVASQMFTPSDITVPQVDVSTLKPGHIVSYRRDSAVNWALVQRVGPGNDVHVGGIYYDRPAVARNALNAIRNGLLIRQDVATLTESTLRINTGPNDRVLTMHEEPDIEAALQANASTIVGRVTAETRPLMPLRPYPMPAGTEVVVSVNLTYRARAGNAIAKEWATKLRGLTLTLGAPGPDGGYLVRTDDGQVNIPHAWLGGVVAMPVGIADIAEGSGQAADRRTPFHDLLGKWLVYRLADGTTRFMHVETVTYHRGSDTVVYGHTGETIARALRNRRVGSTDAITTGELQRYELIDGPDATPARQGDLIRYVDSSGDTRYGVVQETDDTDAYGDFVPTLAEARNQELSWMPRNLRQKMGLASLEVLPQGRGYRQGVPLARRAAKAPFAVARGNRLLLVEPKDDAAPYAVGDHVIVRPSMPLGVQFADHVAPHAANEAQAATSGRLAVIEVVNPNSEGGYLIKLDGEADARPDIYCNAMLWGRVADHAGVGDLIEWVPNTSRGDVAVGFEVIATVTDDNVHVALQNTTLAAARAAAQAQGEEALYDDDNLEQRQTPIFQAFKVHDRAIIRLAAPTEAEVVIAIPETPAGYPTPTVTQAIWNVPGSPEYMSAQQKTWAMLEHYRNNPGLPTTFCLEVEGGLMHRKTLYGSGEANRGNQAYSWDVNLTSSFHHWKGKPARPDVVDWRGGWFKGTGEGNGAFGDPTTQMEVVSPIYSFTPDAVSINRGQVRHIGSVDHIFQNAGAWLKHVSNKHPGIGIVLRGQSSTRYKSNGAHRHVGFAYSRTIVQERQSSPAGIADLKMKMGDSWHFMLEMSPLLVTLGASACEPGGYPTGRRNNSVSISSRMIGAAGYGVVTNGAHYLSNIQRTNGDVVFQYQADRALLHVSSEYGTMEMRMHDEAPFQVTMATALIENVLYTSGLYRLRPPAAGAAARPATPTSRVHYGFDYGAPTAMAAEDWPVFEHSSRKGWNVVHSKLSEGIYGGIKALDVAKYLDYLFTFHKWTWDRIGGARNIPQCVKDILWLAEQGWDFARISTTLDATPAGTPEQAQRWVDLQDALMESPLEFIAPLQAKFPSKFGRAAGKVPVPDDGFWDEFLARHEALTNLHMPAAPGAEVTDDGDIFAAARNPTVHRCRSPQDWEWVALMGQGGNRAWSAMAPFSEGSDRDPIRWTAPSLQGARSRVQVATASNGVRMGFVVYNTIQTGNIHALFVLPEYRASATGSNVEQALLRAALTDIVGAAANIATISIWQARDQAMERLLAGHGFRPVQDPAAPTGRATAGAAVQWQAPRAERTLNFSEEDSRYRMDDANPEHGKATGTLYEAHGIVVARGEAPRTLVARLPDRSIVTLHDAGDGDWVGLGARLHQEEAGATLALSDGSEFNLLGNTEGKRSAYKQAME